MLMSHEVVEMQNLEQKDLKHQHVTLQELQKQQKLQGSKEEVRETMVHDEIETRTEAVEGEIVHDDDQTSEAVEDEKSQTEENNQFKGEEAAGSHSIWYLLNSFKGNQAEQQQKKNEAEDEPEDLSGEVQTVRDEQKSEDEKQQLLKKLKEAQEEANRRWKEVNDIRKEFEDKLKNKNAEISKLKGELNKQLWKEKEKDEKFDRELNELLTMNTEWQRKFQEEITKRMKAEKELETLKKPLKTKLERSKSEDVDHQIKSRQQSSSSSDHSDLRDIILENIDQRCRSVHLKNTSREEKLLGGCKLELHINNRELSIYTFDQSFKVKAEGKITLWHPDCGSEFAPTGDLVWRDLKRWKPTDQLQFVLISQTGKTKVL
ncbi:golgin subfamily A member 6-like protein 22 [Acanthochromis polyacanthus]|uniref:golgin subfamily A member 6-like protein 22 n=1 Tax=Acanthochromis polyacanthus TaxID=80966 RepID=UPI0022340197|nr:golgin subfamily A member 6-like protein 22 [Acanthochromis polyacanthus]